MDPEDQETLIFTSNPDLMTKFMNQISLPTLCPFIIVMSEKAYLALESLRWGPSSVSNTVSLGKTVEKNWWTRFSASSTYLLTVRGWGSLFICIGPHTMPGVPTVDWPRWEVLWKIILCPQTQRDLRNLASVAADMPLECSDRQNADSFSDKFKVML